MPQDNLHKHIVSAAKEHNLFCPDDCLIVAVSGGADSVALLDLLATLPCYSLRLIVAHLNHLLRGNESDADEQFVRQLAQQYTLPCEVGRVDIRRRATETRKSLEEAGREARYTFFEKLRQRHGADAIAVAHHADDQAETFLLRLIRGAGTTGLSAMLPRNASRIVRPLLAVSRDDLRKHLQERQLSFREDASNQDQAFLRNRIRHELLPLLQSYGSNLPARIAQTAQLLGQDEQLLDQITQTALQHHACSGDGWIALHRDHLLQQPRALRMRLYRAALLHALGNLRRYNYHHFNLLDNHLQQGSTGGRLSLPQGMVTVLTADQLLCAQRELLRPQPVTPCVIQGPGSYDLKNGLTLLVETTAAPRPEDWHDLTPSVSYVDPSAAAFPWEVRPARPGDRMQLAHLTGSANIKEVLVNAKLPQHLRPNLPLILCRQQVLWLGGLKRSGLALVQPGQSTALRLTLQGQEQMPLFTQSLAS